MDGIIPTMTTEHGHIDCTTFEDLVEDAVRQPAIIVVIHDTRIIVRLLHPIIKRTLKIETILGDLAHIWPISGSLLDHFWIMRQI